MSNKTTASKTEKFEPAELLKNEAVISEYLNAELAAGDPKYIKIALANIAKARNIAQLAKKTGLGRATIYRALNPDVNSEYETIQKIVNALDLQLVVVPKDNPLAIAG